MFEQLLEWDHEALIYLNNFGSNKYDVFWLITTNFLTWIPLFIFIIILLFITYRGKESIWIALSFLLMLIILTIVIFSTKEAIGRLRPVNDSEINTFLRIITNPSDFSFFSGHAASSFSIATMAFLYLRKRIKSSYLLFLWPLLFSFSRLYLGVHYPLDILVGSLVGVFFAYVFYKMHQKFRAPYIL